MRKNVDTTTGEVKPLYQLFDALTDEEFASLKEDIRSHGVLVPVELDEAGNILDGHHRIRAWQELREEGEAIPEYQTITRYGLSEEQKRNHARALNLLRRQLDKEQRVKVFADMRADGMSYRQIAEATGTPVMTVHASVVRNGTTEQPNSITGKNGKSYPARRTPGIHAGDAEKTRDILKDAHELVRTCVARWAISELWKLEDLIERFKRAERDPEPELHTFWTIFHSGYIQAGEEYEACYYPTATRAEVKKADKANADYRKQLARDEKRERILALPQGVYNVIYADPPWQYSNTGVHGAAEPHYETMPTEDICALLRQIELQIDDNAVLFMWVTNAHIQDAMLVLDAWNFNYKTNMVWVKTELEKPGSGWYVRGRHELLFIATRGSFVPLDPNIAPPIGSVITAPLQEHSRKPDEVYDVIERLYPGCRYVELFARRSRPGWDTYGNEIVDDAE